MNIVNALGSRPGEEKGFPCGLTRLFGEDCARVLLEWGKTFGLTNVQVEVTARRAASIPDEACMGEAVETLVEDTIREFARVAQAFEAPDRFCIAGSRVGGLRTVALSYERWFPVDDLRAVGLRAFSPIWDFVEKAPLLGLPDFSDWTYVPVCGALILCGPGERPEARRLVDLAVDDAAVGNCVVTEEFYRHALSRHELSTVNSWKPGDGKCGCVGLASGQPRDLVNCCVSLDWIGEHYYPASEHTYVDFPDYRSAVLAVRGYPGLYADGYCYLRAVPSCYRLEARADLGRWPTVRSVREYLDRMVVAWAPCEASCQVGRTSVHVMTEGRLPASLGPSLVVGGGPPLPRASVPGLDAAAVRAAAAVPEGNIYAEQARRSLEMVLDECASITSHCLLPFEQPRGGALSSSFAPALPVAAPAARASGRASVGLPAPPTVRFAGVADTGHADSEWVSSAECARDAGVEGTMAEALHAGVCLGLDYLDAWHMAVLGRRSRPAVSGLAESPCVWLGPALAGGRQADLAHVPVKMKPVEDLRLKGWEILTMEAPQLPEQWSIELVANTILCFGGKGRVLVCEDTVDAMVWQTRASGLVVKVPEAVRLRGTAGGLVNCVAWVSKAAGLRVPYDVDRWWLTVGASAFLLPHGPDGNLEHSRYRRGGFGQVTRWRSYKKGDRCKNVSLVRAEFPLKWVRFKAGEKQTVEVGPFKLEAAAGQFLLTGSRGCTVAPTTKVRWKESVIDDCESYDMAYDSATSAVFEFSTQL